MTCRLKARQHVNPLASTFQTPVVMPQGWFQVSRFWRNTFATTCVRETLTRAAVVEQQLTHNDTIITIINPSLFHV